MSEPIKPKKRLEFVRNPRCDHPRCQSQLGCLCAMSEDEIQALVRTFGASNTGAHSSALQLDDELIEREIAPAHPTGES
jgi:hypothetical protein